MILISNYFSYNSGFFQDDREFKPRSKSISYSVRISKWLFMFIVLLSLSCTATKNTNSTSSSDSLEGVEVVPGRGEQSPASWDLLFRKVTGVQVLGTYPNIRIKIRGATSLNLTTEPLFVLDGRILGNSFRDLAQSTTPAEVASIRVLKGSEAGAYGLRGANGVIEVRQKKTN